ncbi:MAG: NAD-dependent malic enzyme 1 [Myxococcales bacterium]|nr:NAD-dependent malic enzyme 1 [Myxococcales bacterium]|tara:strand:- start:507 stop:1910 length:1404 start_codon:yes stop_codon:yes gene_type:complete
MSKEKLVRTVRIRTKRKVGNLGVLTTALGNAGASIGEIVTFKLGHNYTIRDFSLFLNDKDHLRMVLRSVDSLPDSEVIEVQDNVRRLHQDGKVRMMSRVPLTDINLLRTVYVPGAKEIVRRIQRHPEEALTYTGVGRTVGIVSNGSGLLGVGRVNPRAMLPMLEGKAALLADMVGISGLPLPLDVTDESHFVDTVLRLAPACGALLLDAMPAPRGQRVCSTLDKELDIPIYHDDADSPAVIGLASFVNACARAGLDPLEVKVGQVGLGTAGGSIARLLMRYTENPVLGDDIHPEAINQHVAEGGIAANLDEIMKTCDVVIANTGHGRVIKPSQVQPGQVIIALSEPEPEIETYDATLAGAALAADGKSVHKAVVFPGMLLGAMWVRARTINDEMRVAASLSLASQVEEGDLVPSPLTDGVHAKVAASVTAAAISSGVAQIDVDDDEIRAEHFEKVIHGWRDSGTFAL